MTVKRDKATCTDPFCSIATSTAVVLISRTATVVVDSGAISMYGEDRLNAYSTRDKIGEPVAIVAMLARVRMNIVPLRAARSITDVKSNIEALQLDRKLNPVPAHAPNEH